MKPVNTKLRAVNTRFWEDSYILKLSDSEKLIFIYLLTNSETNLAGCYEITLEKIAFNTGIEPAKIDKILKKLEQDNKIRYVKEFIIIKNFLKHQKINKSMATNIDKTISQLPEEIKQAYLEFVKPEIYLDTLSTPCQHPVDTLSTLCQQSVDNLRQIESEVESEIENEIEIEIESESEGESENRTHKLNQLKILKSYWQAIHGRNGLLENEFIEEMFNKFGFDKTKRLIREYKEKNFKSLKTMKEALNDDGTIKPKPEPERKKRGATDEELARILSKYSQ